MFQTKKFEDNLIKLISLDNDLKYNQVNIINEIKEKLSFEEFESLTCVLSIDLTDKNIISTKKLYQNVISNFSDKSQVILTNIFQDRIIEKKEIIDK